MSQPDANAEPHSQEKRSFASPRCCLISVLLAVAALVAIGVGGSALVASYQAAAHRTRCSKHMKLFGLAFHSYYTEHGTLPPAYLTDEDGKPMHSWRVLILPFMEQQELYDQYNFDEPWNGPNNRLLWSKMPKFYSCPEAEFDAPLTSYQVAVGPGTAFDPEQSITFDDMLDGTSNTVLVFDAAADPVIWTEPRDIPYDPDEPLSPSFRTSAHRDGMIAGRADGSTLHLKGEVSDQKLRSLIERSNGG